MNLPVIFIIVFLCAGSVSCFQSDFDLTKPSSDKNIILRDILTNYLKKYFNDAKMFVSIILPSSEKAEHDFLDVFLNDPRMQMFTFNILDKLDGIIHENRHAFNLIFAHDTDSLQWVYFDLVTNYEYVTMKIEKKKLNKKHKYK